MNILLTIIFVLSGVITKNNTFLYISGMFGIGAGLEQISLAIKKLIEYFPTSLTIKKK